METLYSKDKSGKIRYWKIFVEDTVNGVFITRKYGQIDGKETVTSSEITSGKNIGRSNETTKLEQATLEAKSLYKKQVEAGFTPDKDSLSDQVTVLPMLANKWEDRAHNISEPFFVQPKLDGVRMIIGRHQGEVKTLSRTGKVFKMPHIEQLVAPFLQDGEFLDGELFSDELTFQEITGVCGAKKNTSHNLNKIKFHVFDYFDVNNLDEPFEERMKKLFQFEKVVNLVPTFKILKKSEVQTWHDKFAAEGHEGIMVRHSQGKYAMNQRSNHLLKYKAFQTDEYLIIGASEGKGPDAGTVIWECGCSKGSFSVRPKGTREQRTHWFQNYQKFLGKKLTVQFQNLTDGGLPRFPVGLAIRDYE
jgi:ATP-dependent DNA ligase